MISEKGKLHDQFMGSSNFNERSTFRDSESNCAITTFDEKFLERAEEERRYHLSFADSKL